MVPNVPILLQKLWKNRYFLIILQCFEVTVRKYNTTTAVRTGTLNIISGPFLLQPQNDSLCRNINKI